jgi:hypothetical protein
MDSFEIRPGHHSQFQATTGPAIHQYACQRCRSRRVRCDKVLTGCAPCASHGAQCVYSARRPRRPNKNPVWNKGGQRSLLPTTNKFRTLLSAEVVLEDEERLHEHSTSDSEDTIILRELRDGLYEASKDRDGGIVIGPPGDAEIVAGERRKQVRTIS